MFFHEYKEQLLKETQEYLIKDLFTILFDYVIDSTLYNRIPKIKTRMNFLNHNLLVDINLSYNKDFPPSKTFGLKNQCMFCPTSNKYTKFTSHQWMSHIVAIYERYKCLIGQNVYFRNQLLGEIEYISFYYVNHDFGIYLYVGDGEGIGILLKKYSWSSSDYTYGRDYKQFPFLTQQNVHEAINNS